MTIATSQVFRYLSHHLHPCKLPELLLTSIIHNGWSLLQTCLISEYSDHTNMIELAIKTAYRFPTCASLRSENLKFSGEHVARPPSTLAHVNVYRRNWLLSACAYNTQQQENMRLTGSMRLIKVLKHGRWGVHKERVEGRKAYSDGQGATRERNSRRFLLQPTSSLLSGLV